MVRGEDLVVPALKARAQLVGGVADRVQQGAAREELASAVKRGISMCYRIRTMT